MLAASNLKECKYWQVPVQLSFWGRNVKFCITANVNIAISFRQQPNSDCDYRGVPLLWNEHLLPTIQYTKSCGEKADDLPRLCDGQGREYP